MGLESMVRQTEKMTNIEMPKAVESERPSGVELPELPNLKQYETVYSLSEGEDASSFEQADKIESERPIEGELPHLENETKENNIEAGELVEKNGGSYRDVKQTSNGETHEVHHMPADSASPLERDDGPAIKMEKEDHRQTASCGSSREAREYREIQKELIEQEKFKDALQMDIDDIHDKFGNKYDDAIAEMFNYVSQLEQEGKI